MTETQYEKWKQDTEDIKKHFIEVCEKICTDWSVHKGELSKNFFTKSKMKPGHMNQVARNKYMPLLETIKRNLDIYYSVGSK